MSFVIIIIMSNSKFKNIHISNDLAITFTTKDDKRFRASMIDVLDFLHNKVRVKHFKKSTFKWGYQRLLKGELLKVLNG